MPVSGTCRLCLEEKDLFKSHFIPDALYPRGRQESRTITRDVVQPGRTKHIKEHLLCRECEDRFERNGESEVLKWLSPKAKTFALGDRLRVAWPREAYPDISRFDARDIDVEAGKFAYFAVSIIWRAAVYQWTLPDGALSTKLDLGVFEDLVRCYLLDRVPFPADIMSVVVIVCSDAHSRSIWGLPVQNHEAGCENYRFIARGVVFRVLVGTRIPHLFREGSCISPRRCIFYGDAAHRVKKDFAPLFDGFESKRDW
ncbi:MAG TPA: hypothetical protein VKF41_09905 [Bryobacteraceae bacterium]|nr:hypothetical protein [Bryobacteraceae bacterium]